jgi:hypothetical protein
MVPAGDTDTTYQQRAVVQEDFFDAQQREDM